MVTVAVAGGTGGIGKTIVEELVRQGKYEVVVLSRKASAIPELSIPVIAANYDDRAALKKLLEDHNVEVIISAIIIASEQSSKAQLNLIDAASKSTTVKRFIPSEYGIKYTPEMLSFHPAAQWWLDAADALRKTQVQFTRIIFGWLMDFLGLPHVKSNMQPFKYVLDFDNHKAAIPGDGKTPVTLLHSNDLAKYVAALLEEDSWPEVSAFAGDRISWGEMAKLAERVTGTKWDITYDPVEKLEKGEATLLAQAPASYGLDEAGTRQMVAEFGLMAVKGIMDVSGEGLRNAEFPAIKPVTVEELIETAWGSKRPA